MRAPAEHPDLISSAHAGPARHADAADPASDAAPPDTGRIYIVDPLGNLMMSYAADAPDKALLDDLKRLLRLHTSAEQARFMRSTCSIVCVLPARCSRYVSSCWAPGCAEDAGLGCPDWPGCYGT